MTNCHRGRDEMKTIVIWDNCEADLKFFVLDRDVSHLNHHYVNSSGTPDDLADEISNLVYAPGSGERIVEMQSDFPYDASKGEFKVITCGFLP